MINYIKNLFKKQDKAFEENQKKLAKLKPSLDAIADRKLKKAKDDILKTKEKYQSVFDGEFEFMGITYIPYSITVPYVSISVSKYGFEKEFFDTFPKIYEFKNKDGKKYLSEKLAYIENWGEYKISCFTNVKGQSVRHSFVGKDEIDAIIKYLNKE